VILARIAALSRNAEASPVTLARAISVDPIFSAGVIAAVTAGWVGNPLKREPEGLNEAILAAGAPVVVRTALLVALAQISVDLMRGRVVTALAFVQQAVGCAHVAETLGSHLQVSGINGFMVGALGRIGLPVTAYALATNHDALLRGVSGSASRPQDAERSALGFDHLDVGREIAHQFELPDSVALASGPGKAGAAPAARLREVSWTILEQMGFHLGLANVPHEFTVSEQRAIGLNEPTMVALGQWIPEATHCVESSWCNVVHE